MNTNRQSVLIASRHHSILPISSLFVATLAIAPGIEAAPSKSIPFGSYISYQVNVDSRGLNIPTDKGNEPTIAINPRNPANIVIGWRKFDAPATGLKHGGYGYSFDGGRSWNSGELPSLPLQNRTDPSLDVDSEGNFYYQSLAIGAPDGASVFKSIDGGANWSEPAFQFYGDKNWLVIDKSGGNSDGYIYSTWRKTVLPNPDPNYIAKYFIRSTDGGLTYQEPDTALPVSNFGFGRLTVGNNGDVYLFGVDETATSTNALGVIRRGHYFLKSTNAKDPAVSPTFSAKKVDMGGDSILFLSAQLDLPNPLGGDGDTQIAVDQSNGTMRGNMYLMAHVAPYNWQPGNDPLDLRFVRSNDGGETWSAPIRINDDSLSPTAYQWFPMLGVAPNSRIDAVWYDTRNGSGNTPYRFSQLYYSYSWDGGVTWSPNQPITPAFNTHLPYTIVNGLEKPSDKLGDYTQLVSDSAGAHVAYSATFNGEQDVYYLNVFPDCNHNKLSDVIDITNRQSGDTNGNHLPDSCENISVIGDLDGDKDVDQLDLNLLLAAKNRPASSPTDPKDLDKNGAINALDARKQVLLCTRPRCAV